MKNLHAYEVLPNPDSAQDYRDILVRTQPVWTLDLVLSNTK